MASISTDKKTGLKRILFFNANGERKTIRLGKANQRQAESIKCRIESLVATQIQGIVPDDDTSRWLARKAGHVMREMLAAVGLAEKPAQALLGAFVADYIARRNHSLSLERSKWNARPKRLFWHSLAPRSPYGISMKAMPWISAVT
jgi:hypothetical protein